MCIAATICVLLIVTALLVKYPRTARTVDEPIDLKRTMRMMRSPYALGFSLGIFLYVAVECAVYVWMPTLMAGYSGSLAFMAAYAISIFFVLRAAGRFLGAWVLARFNWTSVMAVFSLAIFVCFAGSIAGGVSAAVCLLPLSGLFMSMIYPTLNSKGISCFPKTRARDRRRRDPVLHLRGRSPRAAGHGRRQRRLRAPEVRLRPRIRCSRPLLFVGLLLNWIYNPARERLVTLDSSEYTAAGTP